MFKAECGIELDTSISTAEDARIKRLLSNTQKWLCGQHLFLLGKTSKDIQLAAGTRHYTFPTTDLDIDRLEKRAVVKLGPAEPPLRYDAHFGITQEHYTAWDSEAGQTCDPVQRWDLVNVAGVLKVEVWPIPETSNQKLNLTGIMPLPALSADTDVCAIDDLLIVLFAAAKYQARRGDKDASATLKQAQLHLGSLRASKPSQFERFNMAGKSRQQREPRPIIGVSNV